MSVLFCGILFLISTSFASSEKEPWVKPPHWSSLQQYEKTITAGELENLLQTVYVPDGSWRSWITITPQVALIEPFPGAPSRIQLPLAVTRAEERTPFRYWKNFLTHHSVSHKPLAGLSIALDPGHLGGPWAKMEERWFRIGNTRPIEEGTMTLFEARLLAKRLEALGAKVCFTRNHLGPTTSLRPQQLRKAAQMQLQKECGSYTSRQLKAREEILFYRVAEIHHRAEFVNHVLRPDLVICLHFDAEEWGNPKHPQLGDNNRVHFLVAGDFNASELESAEDRYAMLRKLLGRSHNEEVSLANAVAKSFVAATNLPPLIYHNPTKARQALPSSLYIWNRNLLATRLIEAPVLYCEPYIMNSHEVFERVQLGDYSGYRVVRGKKYRSIYREYADAVAEGLVNYFK